MSVLSKHLIISGRVQGVFYRKSTQQEAYALGLSGWVRNMPDGRVEIKVSGECEDLEKLIIWAGKGPSDARVDGVEVIECDEQFNGPFIISR
jgi:acylphosphatase